MSGPLWPNPCKPVRNLLIPHKDRSLFSLRCVPAGGCGCLTSWSCSCRWERRSNWTCLSSMRAEIKCQCCVSRMADICAAVERLEMNEIRSPRKSRVLGGSRTATNDNLRVTSEIAYLLAPQFGAPVPIKHSNPDEFASRLVSKVTYAFH